MTDYHRDPTGKRALFEAPVTAAPDRVAVGPTNEGRAALFSTAPRRSGTVVVECGGCRARTRVSAVDLGVLLVAGSVWNPLRRHSHWMRCPSCRTREWCRIGWTD
ncbi:MAG: hypothetical protein JWO37_2976 [Acidimicrobiales bacterium]|jgi:hypothetical protein|nr:hypothetical protein [Acidimicrobiales bacterium]